MSGVAPGLFPRTGRGMTPGKGTMDPRTCQEINMKRLGWLTLLAALTVMAVVAAGYAGGSGDWIDLILLNTTSGQPPRVDSVSPDAHIRNFDNLVGLSEEQKARMKDVVEAANKATEGYQTGKADEFKAAWAALHDAHQSGDKDAISKAKKACADLLAPLYEMTEKSKTDRMDVLTPEQKDRWAKARERAINEANASVSLRDAMGVKDNEEWTVLGGRIRKVRTLLWLLASHGRTGRGPNGELNNLEKAWGALASALKSKESKPADLKNLLQAVHAEEARIKAELVQARKELRDLVTVRQEGVLVQEGLLE